MEKNVMRGEVVHGLKATGVLPVKAKMDLMGDMDEDVWCVKYEVDNCNVSKDAREGFDWPPEGCTEVEWAIPEPPEGVTLQEAQDRVIKNLGAGSRCPCCGQMAKIYPRKIYATMAVWLMWLVGKFARGLKHAIHVNDIPNPPKGGDYAKLRFWDLIRQPEEPEAPPEKRTSGCWVPTALGEEYVAKRVAPPRQIGVYDNQVMWESNDKADIVDALGEKFDYDEIRRGYMPTEPSDDE